MKDRVEEFQEEYKKLEIACRSKNKEVLEMEQYLGIDRFDPEACKLKMCRQLRNFIAHNEYEGFITITPGMIKFVKGMVKVVKNIKTKKK